MTSVLLLAEHDGKTIKKSSLIALTAAKKLGEVTFFIAGHECAEAAKSATEFKGIHKVIAADNLALKDLLAENAAPLIAKLGAGYDYIIAPSTSAFKNILPRVSALLDVQMISDVVQIISHDAFVKPIYAGNAFATIKSSDKIKVMTIRTTAFEASDAKGGNATIETITDCDDSGLSQFVKRDVNKSTRPELTSARIVVAGGRGVGSRDMFRMIEDLADKLGAAVGASRAAVDAGFIGNDCQVGQTGKSVAPELYMAIGISGAAQHIAGMKDSKVIVAINKDPDAPIFKVADYILVADLFEALPEIYKSLS